MPRLLHFELLTLGGSFILLFDASFEEK